VTAESIKVFTAERVVRFGDVPARWPERIDL